MENKKLTIDDLGVMIKEGFDYVDSRFDGMQKQLDGMKIRLELLEQGQEDIKLRLGEVAYHFELVGLKKRVEILERKISVA